MYTKYKRREMHLLKIKKLTLSLELPLRSTQKLHNNVFLIPFFFVELKD